MDQRRSLKQQCVLNDLFQGVNYGWNCQGIKLSRADLKQQGWKFSKYSSFFYSDITEK